MSGAVGSHRAESNQMDLDPSRKLHVECSKSGQMVSFPLKGLMKLFHQCRSERDFVDRSDIRREQIQFHLTWARTSYQTQKVTRKGSTASRQD